MNDDLKGVTAERWREMVSTRIFRRKGQKKATSITLSLSMATELDAARVARAINAIKARAACDGMSMSELVGLALIDYAHRMGKRAGGA